MTPDADLRVAVARLDAKLDRILEVQDKLTMFVVESLVRQELALDSLRGYLPLDPPAEN